jgi:exopolysaccharide biosynthesis polyprenyl glycosylphosphotransferase
MITTSRETPEATLSIPARTWRARIAFGASTRDSTVRHLLGYADAVAVLLALSLALVLAGRSGQLGRLAWGLAALPLMILLFKLYGLYDRDVKRMSHSTVDDLPWLFHAVVMGTLILWLYAKVSPLHRLDFLEVLIFAGLTLTFATLARFTVRVSCAHRLGPEPTVLVGGGQLAAILVAKLAAHPEYSSKVVGVLAARGGLQPEMAPAPLLGEVAELETVVARYGVRRVIISAADIEESDLEELLRNCRAQALKVSVLPQLSEVLGPAVEVDDVEGVTVLGVNPPWLSWSSRALKRVLDIALATTLLILTAPVLAVIAVAVKLSSPGPILFRQRRVGKSGQIFTVLKFRTMVADAEQLRSALLEQSKDPHWLHLEQDPRITPIGRRLRLSSLDELPQLVNVLLGQMSMVGPRPLIESEDQMVEGWARGRLDLTPGITGYWQVLGRTRIPFEEMVKLDYLYVMNWSLWGDLRLIMRTLPTVIGRRGAN